MAIATIDCVKRLFGARPKAEHQLITAHKGHIEISDIGRLLRKKEQKFKILFYSANKKN